ncbi:hypothetical protein BD410DRAFT_175961 [Rickenella mellea]|uniref:Uncharacterized protein n=1 Tax=Rickenella mellea TaxID=50990 RepID=A0A4Y7Q8V2_9AGAM|nr:hypothetical protein BD410DRAFT_175961 [Rickenella mellea]
MNFGLKLWALPIAQTFPLLLRINSGRDLNMSPKNARLAGVILSPSPVSSNHAPHSILLAAPRGEADFSHYLGRKHSPDHREHVHCGLTVS